MDAIYVYDKKVFGAIGFVRLLPKPHDRIGRQTKLVEGHELTTDQSGCRIHPLLHTAAKMASSLWLSDNVTQLECNLDDATGELVGHAMELLLERGALDAWASPIVMKKGRPAHTLHCLCHPDDESKILEALFRHTTTLGIRIHREIPRAKLCRSFHIAQTPYRDSPRDGQVHVKVSSFVTGEIVSVKPEFDDCQSISRASGVPVKIIAEAALSDFRTRRLDSNTGTGITMPVAESL